MLANLARIHDQISTSLVRMLQGAHFVPVCFGSFLAIRLAVVLFVPTAEPFSDAAWYLNTAVTLVEQGSYSERGTLTAYWPVGYPALLALMFKIAGPSLLVAQLANLIFAAATFWLLYLVVQRSLHDDLVARGAVLLLTTYPNNVAYVPVLMTETLYTFLLLAATFCLVCRRRWFHIALAGGAFGLATLVKTQTVLLIPLLPFLATLEDWSIRNFGRAIRHTLAVAVVAFAVVTPWAVRNYNALGAFVLSTNGGPSLLAGNNPSVVGDYRHDYSEDDPLFKQAKFSVEDQIGADRRARALAYGWIRENLGQFVQLIPKKVFRLWAPDGEAEWMYQDTPFYQKHKSWFRFVRLVNQAFYVTVLLLLLPAFWKLVTMHASPAMYFGVAVVLVFTLISVIVSGQSRYHFPAMPFVLTYAAWIIVRGVRPRIRVDQRQGRPSFS